MADLSYFFKHDSIVYKLDFKILNVITLGKNNPPPNFSCRFHILLGWCGRKKKSIPLLATGLMKQLNDNKQMKDV